MRKLICLLMLFGPVAGHSATIVIDFEEFAGANLASYGPVVETQGFRFTNDDTFFSLDPNSNSQWDSTVLMSRADTDPWMSMTSVTGLDFDLYSIDLYFLGPGPWSPMDVDFIALDADGQIIAQMTELEAGIVGRRTIAFDSSWTGIHTFKMTHTANAEDFWVAPFDNVTVSVVPIPAAVWLFGSALVVLGWIRPKPDCRKE